MRSFRSPTIVGRRDELDLLLTACRLGAPPTVVLVGPAGMGKSRLVQALCEQAHEWGLRTAVGRAAPSTDVPFRALAEALRDAARSSRELQERTADVALGRHAHAVDAGDAVLSLLSAGPGERPVLCVLEDLHWADQETLDAVEYVADHSASGDVRIVLTGRPEESPAFDELVDRLAHRGAATKVALAPLDDDDVARLVTAALPAGSTLPRDVQALVVRSAAGTPLYVEDLLAALLTDGADVAPSQRVGVPGDGAGVVVPVSFVDSVARRLRRLDPSHRQVVDAAALLATTDEDLLAEVCGLAAADVAAGLWAATDEQLFVVTSHGLDFRHALTRSAVAALLPGTRRERLAVAGLRVLTTRFPTWPGIWAERAAELARLAGDGERSAELSLTWARRLVDQGLLSAARDYLERELPLQPAGTSADRLSLMLVEVLATAGDHPAAAAVGDAVAPSLQGERLVELHLALARSAVQATDWASARSHLDAATASSPDLHAGPEAGTLARLAVLAVTRADVALGTFEPQAEALAVDAVRAAEAGSSPSLQSDALDALGRALRRHDLDAAEAVFDRAARLAERAGDAYRRARAVHQVGTITLLRDVDEGRLAEAQSLAERCGAAQLAAHATYHRGVVAFLTHDVARARGLLDLAESQAARYGLRSLQAAVVATQAALAAAVGDADRARPLISRAVRIAGDDAEAAARARGQGEGMLALAREDRAAAREALRAAMDVARRTPGTSPAPYKGLWALTEVAAGTDGALVRAELVTTGALVSRVNRGCLGWVDAISAGRDGDLRRARELSDEAHALLARTPWFQQMARRIAADVAAPWADTGQWLREAAAWFDAAGNPAVADAARATLRRSGQAVPRRRADGVDVPPAWAGLGVTRREAEVLGAVAEGIDNAEIGRRLFISPRTVEKHVENLQLKTGVASRSQLVAFALRHDPPEHTQPPR
jgi:DNA-binding CsgD family transcriptional regulator